MKSVRILFLVLMIVMMISACARQTAEEKREAEAARAQFANLVHADLVEVKSGHVLYITENMMNDHYVHAIPFVGAGQYYYDYDPVTVSKCLVRVVPKGHPDYDKVLLAFAKQGKWYSLK